jgi:hypothetical protein
MDLPQATPQKYRKIFNAEEDEELLRLVAQYGCDDWALIASQMGSRTPRQCRERYKTYLCPDVNTAPWSPGDDELLLDKYQMLGSKWSDYRPFFPNRTVNNIKNRWHTLARRTHQAPSTATPLAVPAPPALPGSPEPTGLAVYTISNLLNHDRRVFC